ncbi:MAG: minor capsid protein [Candidatus Omnitrophica bacterium]|jgi:hypothetical protein|nr:minor capsid protein [Candidatus Omnitrophota bacterium]
MNASAVDIKQIIEYYYAEDSYVGDLYPIFIGKEPASPVNTISIFETMGYHQLTFNKCEIYEYPSIQIRIRSSSYLEGWQMIADIKEILHGRASETWNGTLYTLIRCAGGPALLDFDKDQRVRFICNFNIQRR